MVKGETMRWNFGGFLVTLKNDDTSQKKKTIVSECIYLMIEDVVYVQCAQPCEKMWTTDDNIHVSFF